MPSWVTYMISIISCFIGVATFYLKIRNDMKSEKIKEEEARKEEIDAITKSISTLRDNLDGRLDSQDAIIASLKSNHGQDMKGMELLVEKKCHEKMEELDRRRSAANQRLYDKLDNFEKTYGSQTIEKISRLEGLINGKLDTIEKTINVIQASVIEARK